MIRFVIKKDVDLDKLKEYGFVEETNKYTYSESVVKLCVDKKTRMLKFNMPSNTTIKVYTQMVKDDIVAIVDNYSFPKGYHYIGLTDDEFNLIQEMRVKKNER